MQFWRKHNWWIITALLSFVFVWLRLYKIETSLLFFNDIGRDFLELWKWQHTNKPPLLGPQTSALPFNQSAFYFYLLMPAYLLTQGSPFATIYTVVLVYLALFWLGAIWLRQQPKLLPAFWTMATLLMFHPELIAQQRFVWNPSFIAAWLLISLLASWQLVTHKVAQWSNWWLAAWGLGLSLAVSFSYSVAPALIAVLVLSLIWWRWSAWKLWLSVGLGLGAWNLPTAFFELRHNFLLTQMMLFGDKLPQPGAELMVKFQDLSRLLISPFGSAPGWQTQWWILGGMTLWIGIVLVAVVKQLWQWQQFTKGKTLSTISPIFIWTAGWWLLTLIITLAMPVAVQSHYIFPLLVLGVASLVMLPGKSKWLFVILLILPWVLPARLQGYWLPARRSLAETQSCMTQICQTVSDPLFVSVQAGYHPYHNGMEYQYLLRAAGCTMRDIETQPGQAQLMAVMIDDSVYDHGKTAYRELTLFGQSQVKQEILCTDKLKAVIITK